MCCFSTFPFSSFQLDERKMNPLPCIKSLKVNDSSTFWPFLFVYTPRLSFPDSRALARHIRIHNFKNFICCFSFSFWFFLLLLLSPYYFKMGVNCSLPPKLSLCYKYLQTYNFGTYQPNYKYVAHYESQHNFHN